MGLYFIISVDGKIIIIIIIMTVMIVLIDSLTARRSLVGLLVLLFRSSGFLLQLINTWTGGSVSSRCEVRVDGVSCRTLVTW